MLPISGGWGYIPQDACVIDKYDANLEKGMPFDGYAVERIFVEKRLYEELIIFRLDDERFSGIKWNLSRQSLVEESGRKYDHLVFDVSAFHDRDWAELKAEALGLNGISSSAFDETTHEKKRQERMVRMTVEYWFDITSWFSKG